ncbi:peptidase M13 [Corynebacterium diphtheriae]|nr:peptidase M13 [Corynebacterium diphtheriae]
MLDNLTRVVRMNDNQQRFALSDLYRFVNGPWLDSHVIPEDRGVDGIFHGLRDRAEEDVHTIVMDSADSLAGKLYASFMDTEGIESAGVAALDKDLTLIDVATVPEFVQTLGALDRVGVGGPVGFWVAKDSAGDESVAYIMQSGITLPDEAYYREESHAQTREAYQKHVEKMLGFLAPEQLGTTPIDAATRILALETDIAAAHWDVVQRRDAVKTFNPTEMAELPPQVAALLRAAGLPEHRVISMMPSYFEALESLLTPQRLDDWKLLTTWHILHSRAGVLTPEISRADFEFFGTTLSGATQQRDRWKRALGLAESFVGEEIGALYVERHFPESSKKDMLSLVSYLIEAYRERISGLSWMTPETRERALDKLDKFNAKIGYPDSWRSYAGLEFSAKGTDLLDNVRAGSAFAHDYELNKIGRLADRNEWVTTPQTVNAFYNPVVNDITFPAAILRAPFYSPDADAAENFGAIGAVIGHEIGHGFDDQGSQYDGHGNLESWWTDEDRAAFSALTDRLVEQFEGLVPSVLADNNPSGAGVNGRFTLGENIGDLGGLGIAVIAYRRYLADHGLDFDSTPLAAFHAEDADPELEKTQFTGLQRLFLAWARVWRTAIRPELAAQYLAIDPHSPAEFRCNVIAGNVAEFYQAFDVAEDSPMWIAPEKRVTIW